jgi:hypothetical protein
MGRWVSFRSDGREILVTAEDGPFVADAGTGGSSIETP